MKTERYAEDELVVAALRQAEKGARNDREFVQMLNRIYNESRMQQAVRGARAIAIRAANPSPNRSFRIYEDPRYLANARALARRVGAGRIIGGALVKAGEFVDCVAVGNDQQWGCTGTLIAPNVVVTAGHCADFATRVYFGRDVTAPGKVVKVKKRVPHPKYHKVNRNDLMVLLLAENVTGVTPRPLAKKGLIDAATDARVVGFGNTEASGTFGYGKKRFVDVPIASTSCQGSVDGHDDKVSYGCDPGLELVAGRPMLAQDTCTGDSGGPLYVLEGEKWLLAGATSRATDSAMNNCGDGGVYVRLDKYRAWITSIPGVSLP
jgi:secreted trypsin-like serine protease